MVRKELARMMTTGSSDWVRLDLTSGASTKTAVGPARTIAEQEALKNAPVAVMRMAEKIASGVRRG